MEGNVRIVGFEIKNVKNVEYGKIELKKAGNSVGDVNGIYGQNGSGKSALIDSTEILKDYLLGNALDKYYDLINVNSDSCELAFDFLITCNKKYRISLDIILKKYKESTNELEKEKNKVIVTEEIIKYSELNNDEFKNMKTLIGSSEKNVLSTNETFGKFVNKNKVNLMVLKKLSEINSTSFIFSKEFLEILYKNKDEFENVVEILSLLKKFSLINLIVITNRNIGLINLQTVFPLTIKTYHSSGSFLITGKNIIIDEELYEDVYKVIEQINVVLGAIVPNIRLELHTLHKELVEKDKVNVILELLSVRDGKYVPIKNESEGIKKIISILSALIAAYNDKNVCLVVDELDAGIFEYLLGELLYILSGGINGQLIFTSHNLRILEKLNKECIILTTTNPKNRYTRFKNTKPTNNFRDLYIREMLVQEQKEKLYEETNNGDIEFALYKAGALNGRR